MKLQKEPPTTVTMLREFPGTPWRSKHSQGHHGGASIWESWGRDGWMRRALIFLGRKPLWHLSLWIPVDKHRVCRVAQPLSSEFGKFTLDTFENDAVLGNRKEADAAHRACSMGNLLRAGELWKDLFLFSFHLPPFVMVFLDINLTTFSTNTYTHVHNIVYIHTQSHI